MTNPTETTAAPAAQSQDFIQKADAGLTKLEDTAGSKTGEVADLVQNVVTHLNHLLAAVYSDAKIGFGAVDNGIGGTANLVVSTEALLKGAQAAPAAEPLATPPAGLTTAAG